MGLFGISRTEVNDIAKEHARNAQRQAEINSGNRLDFEKTRICQVVSVLLATLPKAILNKKVERTEIPYGTAVLPYRWFECGGGDNDKLTFKQILEKIDP